MLVIQLQKRFKIYSNIMTSRHAESAGTWALVPRQFWSELFWQAVLGENNHKNNPIWRKTQSQTYKKQADFNTESQSPSQAALLSSNKILIWDLPAHEWWKTDCRGMFIGFNSRTACIEIVFKTGLIGSFSQEQAVLTG